MLTILRRHDFARLWLGQLVSQLGDMVLLTALPFYVYQLTGSIVQTGLMFVVETLPRLLLGALAGVFVDRWNRRWTLILSDAARAAVLLLLLLVHTRDRIWLVYGVALVQSIIGLFFAPALVAFLPGLVAPEDLTAANAMQSLAEALTRFSGPALGGALLGLLGIAGVVGVDSASFAFSAALLLLIAAPSPRRSAGGGSGTSRRWTALWREMGDGLRLVRGSPVLRAIFVSSGLFVLGSGIASVSLVVFVREVMGGTALTMGWMAMAQASGGFLGSLLITRVSRRMRPVYLMAVPLLIAGVTVLVWVNRPALLLVLPLIAIMGVFIVGFGVTSQTLLQGQTADQFRGRVAGALATTNALMLLVGMLIATTLGDRLGVVWLLDGTAILSLLAGIAALFMLRAEGICAQQQAAVETAAALGVAGQDR